jgi:hypothetical protein
MGDAMLLAIREGELPPFRDGDDILILAYPDTGQVTAVLPDAAYECVRDQDQTYANHPENGLLLLPAKIRISSQSFTKIIRADRRGHLVIKHYFGGNGRSIGGRISN